MSDTPAPPLATSTCISLESEEVTLRKDKKISKGNTHRVGEGKEYNLAYAMNKLQDQREETLGMKPSQSSSQVFR